MRFTVLAVLLLAACATPSHRDTRPYMWEAQYACLPGIGCTRQWVCVKTTSITPDRYVDRRLCAE